MLHKKADTVITLRCLSACPLLYVDAFIFLQSQNVFVSEFNCWILFYV